MQLSRGYVVEKSGQKMRGNWVSQVDLKNGHQKRSGGDSELKQIVL